MKFQVRVEETYSKHAEQETGVPQGSILSVTLFCQKDNSIVKALCPGVECSLYIDDFLNPLLYGVADALPTVGPEHCCATCNWCRALCSHHTNLATTPLVARAAVIIV